MLTSQVTGRPSALARRTSSTPAALLQPAQVHARAGVAHQLEDRRQGDRLGQHRHARQAHARGQRALGGDAAAEPRHRSAAARRCSRRSPRTAARAAAPACRASAHRPGRSRRSRPRSARPSRSAPRRPGRASARRAGRRAPGRGFAGAELEHLDQAGLVEHRVGVGRADQAGHAAGDRRGELGLEQAVVLVAGLAQARARSTRPGATTRAAGVDRALGA